MRSDGDSEERSGNRRLGFREKEDISIYIYILFLRMISDLFVISFFFLFVNRGVRVRRDGRSADVDSADATSLLRPHVSTSSMDVFYPA